MKVTTVPNRECPKCKSPSGAYTDFDCPKCGKSFCGSCFDVIEDGDGNSVKCPHCKAVLELP